MVVAGKNVGNRVILYQVLKCCNVDMLPGCLDFISKCKWKMVQSGNPAMIDTKNYVMMHIIIKLINDIIFLYFFIFIKIISNTSPHFIFYRNTYKLYTYIRTYVHIVSYEYLNFTTYLQDFQ